VLSGSSYLSNTCLGRRVDQLFSFLNRPDSTLYGRVVCRVAIAFICRLYPIRRDSHIYLAGLAQEALDLLAAAKIECGPGFYDIHFPRIERLATILRDWHANAANEANEVSSGILLNPLASNSDARDQEMTGVEVDEVGEATDFPLR
jgi:hypothetical protein